MFDLKGNWIEYKFTTVAKVNRKREAETVMMDEFRPAWWLRNRHLQTFLGSRGSETEVASGTIVHRVTTRDGEYLALHEDRPAAASKVGVTGEMKTQADRVPAVVLIHGLAGCHQSGYLVRLGERLLRAGWHVYRMDLRGCGAGEEWAYKPPHAGLTTDVADVLGWIESHQRPAWLALAGFSLGGNLVLKFLGELAQGKFTELNIGTNLRHAVAIGPPIDLNLAADSMERGVSRVYTAYFMRLLKNQLQRKLELWPQWRALKTSQKLATIRQFDDAYTAPLSGFESAAEYYRASSSKPFLAQIEVPCDLLVAEDDPIVPVACFAGLRRGEAWLPKVGGTMTCTRYGGHLGYVSARRTASAREAGRADHDFAAHDFAADDFNGRWMDNWVFESLQRAAWRDEISVPKIAVP